MLDDDVVKTLDVAENERSSVVYERSTLRASYFLMRFGQAMEELVLGLLEAAAAGHWLILQGVV
jgi:hypothetical protein